jgi:hypothetical protein
MLLRLHALPRPPGPEPAEHLLGLFHRESVTNHPCIRRRRSYGCEYETGASSERRPAPQPKVVRLEHKTTVEVPWPVDEVAAGPSSVAVAPASAVDATAARPPLLSWQHVRRVPGRGAGLGDPVSIDGGRILLQGGAAGLELIAGSGRTLLRSRAASS